MKKLAEVLAHAAENNDHLRKAAHSLVEIH